jgi:CubicO group peptidase (beta-lactamase class C family)
MPQLRPVRLLLCLCLLVAPAAALADPPAGFAERVESLRQTFGVPGATVAIVENGRTTMAQGFGITDLNAPSRRVNADTIFATGSTGKAMTSAALAILVDQGRIRWDDRVIDHMPDFRMWDPWVTREMTIRDLLVHRSGLGLGAGDLMFVPYSDLSRRESVRRLRHIQPSTSFRSGYAYDNVLYMVAGLLIEEVTGRTWEQFMVEQVFRPADMNRATVGDQDRLATANRAHPHARLNGAIRGLGDQVAISERGLGGNAAPAGALAISANDMAHWLGIQLAHGAIPGTDRRLFSEEQSREMWTPQVLTPTGQLPEPLRATQPMFSTYALGWTVQDYRGARLIWHGGAVFGSLAAVALLPDRNVGIYIAVNAEEGQMVRGLLYELLDHYLDLPRDSWPEKLHEFRQQRSAAAVAALQAPAVQPARVGPSLPLARYTGAFSDPWYGQITIREENGRLVVAFPHSLGLTATLEHWQYDTFRTRFSDSIMEPAYVTFQLDAQGRVDRITMRAVSPIADFSFDYHDLLFRPVPAAP